MLLAVMSWFWRGFLRAHLGHQSGPGGRDVVPDGGGVIVTVMSWF